jgi:hypothetical protein
MSGNNPEPSPIFLRSINQGQVMLTFLLWCILLIFCWPLALLFLFLYPIVWLILLPFRLLGIAVEGVLELVKAVIFLPARILRGPRRAW